MLRRMLPYIHGFHLRLLAAGLATLAAAVLMLAVPMVIRWGLDTLVVSSRPVVLWGPAALIIVIGLAEGVASFASRYLMEAVGFQVVYRLRSDLYRRLHELSFEFHDKARVGDVMSRLTADTEALSRMFGFALPYIAANSLTIVGAAALLLYWDLWLGLSFILVTPLMVRAMRAYAYTVQPSYRRRQASLGRLTEGLRVALNGVREIQLFGQETQEMRKMAARDEEYVGINLEVARISAYWLPHVHFLVSLATAVALAAGGWAVMSGRATLGMLVGFVTTAGLLVRPIRQTGMLTASVVQAAAAGGRVLEVIDERPAVEELPGAKPLPELRGRVELQGIHFAYVPGNPVLKGIDLVIEPGEVVALVGPTGAGKTTLAHLIPRFYDPQEGRVLLDGVDVRTATLSSIRRQVGTAMQNIFLFNGTIRENIAFGKPEATFAAVQEAAQLAQIHDEIVAFPRGYDTPLGERGASLSGGQRQRLALARVLLTDPRLLILDEVSSELDAVTEAKLRSALERAFTGRTTLVIAHRLWTIQRADRIVVLSNGEVVQQGTHDQLMSSGGLYREIYDALTGVLPGRGGDLA